MRVVTTRGSVCSSSRLSFVGNDGRGSLLRYCCRLPPQRWFMPCLRPRPYATTSAAIRLRFGAAVHRGNRIAGCLVVIADGGGSLCQ